MYVYVRTNVLVVKLIFMLKKRKKIEHKEWKKTNDEIEKDKYTTGNKIPCMLVPISYILYNLISIHYYNHFALIPNFFSSA